MPQVITRPAADRPVEVTEGDAEPMSNDVANALNTGRVLSEATLRMAMAWYGDLAERLLVSGPSFSASRVVAVQMHNRCVARLREDEGARARRERAEAERAAGLVEIE